MPDLYKRSPNFIILGLFFTLVLSSCASSTQHNSARPEAEPDTRIWDFGQVREGKVLKHSFILGNSLKHPLAISSVHTSCGCTVSEVSKKNLSPGEHTQVNVKFNTQGYSGAIKQYVYVHTDDAREPIIKFSIKAEVVK